MALDLKAKAKGVVEGWPKEHISESIIHGQNGLIDAIEQVLKEVQDATRRETILRCAEVPCQGTALESFYGMGPEAIKRAILALLEKK